MKCSIYIIFIILMMSCKENENSKLFNMRQDILLQEDTLHIKSVDSLKLEVIENGD